MSMFENVCKIAKSNNVSSIYSVLSATDAKINKFATYFKCCNPIEQSESSTVMREGLDDQR